MRKILLEDRSRKGHAEKAIETLAPCEVARRSMLSECWFATVIGLLIILAVPDFSSALPLAEEGSRSRGSRIVSGARAEHTCAVREDGTVRCWGSNSSGQLGNNSGGSGQFSATPVQVSGLNDAVALAAGEAGAHLRAQSDRWRCLLGLEWFGKTWRWHDNRSIYSCRCFEPG